MPLGHGQHGGHANGVALGDGLDVGVGVVLGLGVAGGEGVAGGAGVTIGVGVGDGVGVAGTGTGVGTGVGGGSGVGVGGGAGVGFPLGSGVRHRMNRHKSGGRVGSAGTVWTTVFPTSCAAASTGHPVNTMPSPMTRATRRHMKPSKNPRSMDTTIACSGDKSKRGVAKTYKG